MVPGQSIQGPCIIEEFESTTVVGHGSMVRTDEFRNIIIDMTYA
jgi:N-methylhydantoinase A/oxoprolinase/acetone carboxylase beta subunit